jgi:hypothetical protein
MRTLLVAPTRNGVALSSTALGLVHPPQRQLHVSCSCLPLCRWPANREHSTAKASRQRQTVPTSTPHQEATAAVLSWQLTRASSEKAAAPTSSR